MATFHEIDGTTLNYRVGEKLKELLKMPEWAHYVKTGHHNETFPEQVDWWYVRGAAILRMVALRGPLGVSRLRKKFGNKKNRGHKPEKKFISGGKIIRTLLQQLTSTGYIVNAEKGSRKGKILTPKGESFLNSVAKEL
ncbi:40S ribosomal protein S19 [Candidatus Woesearchaeota archaeon]|nr:40S ribosomal protein S19 [Candidatus Woesearchaeota archaeon]MBT4387985.1 40S ribosomal protein S19 [Candidatus Woesearchaeota archaeon]MBT4595329.1 40S ribosomal protein S19 [Candidatus Woesearchaeota archaeon]MBT5741266.1 40S ribosomal protein S19 [Candidatus Woesearchaeota archaeon]MBT7849595.1 40S ribosomal protein S19 [Candidatus Woesearchaeota archaeon]